MSLITISILFGLLSLIPMGLGTSISRVPTQKIGVQKVMLFRNILTSVLLFVVLLFNLKEATFDLPQILFALLLSFLPFIALIYYFKAVAVGKLGLVGPVSSGYVILSLLLSVIFFHIKIPVIQAGCIGIIIAGILLSSINFRDFQKSNFFRKESGIPYALVTAIGWGFFFFFAQISISHLGAFFTSFLFEFGMLIYTVVWLLYKKESFALPDKKSGFLVFLVALLNAISIIGMYYGLKIGSVGIVLALSSATPLVFSLYGKFVYKEKLSLIQYIALLLVLVGIISLGYFK